MNPGACAPRVNYATQRCRGRHLFQKSPLCVIYILAYLYILDLYIVHPIYILTQVFVFYISLDLHIRPSVADYSLSWCKFSVPSVSKVYILRFVHIWVSVITYQCKYLRVYLLRFSYQQVLQISSHIQLAITQIS